MEKIMADAPITANEVAADAAKLVADVKALVPPPAPAPVVEVQWQGSARYRNAGLSPKG